MMLVLGPSLRAAFIQPVAVLVSNGEATQDALINGWGFVDDPSGVGSPQSLHTRSGEMWSAVGSIRESATFDLGQTVSLTKVYIWNYNAQDATDVGMKDVEVQVSSDTDMATANFNAIARISLAEGGEAAQVFDVVGTNVRLVRLKGLSNWGQGYTVGLAEVRFESGEITGNVPTIVLTSPHEGDETAWGTDITVDARITDRDGAADLAKVELFDGDTLVTNRTSAAFTAVVKDATKGDHALRVVATDKSGKVAWVTVNVTVREFVADRITKIDDTADEGTGLNQISYTGAWNLAQGNENDPRYNNNDHYNYSNNRNDYFEVRFEGVMIELFATVASHHGSGMASIDGGPETKVSYKAAQRAEQVLVWRSPILANREHVLRVRIYGDGVVTADRFDVSVSDQPDRAQATLQSFTFNQVVVSLEDVGASVVDPATVTLALDGAAVPAAVSKAGSITTITHTPVPPFAPGSIHTLIVEAQDATGASLSSELSFNLPAPFFPLTGLGGPASTAGNWGLRQIWGAGRADSLTTAVAIALQASQAGFAGRIHDTSVPYLNHAESANPGTGGYFVPDEPLPAEAEGLADSDFVIVGHATVKIPRSGDWTIGVHSDEGFALRFIGAPFAAAYGNGILDENFPEFIAVPVNTADSSTRGVLTGLAAGTYEIEFITWERVGAAYFEVYAAEGAWEDDTWTWDWWLIGDAGGLEIVAGTKLTVLGLTKADNVVTIDFASPAPEGQHQLLESVDLRSWQPVRGATFEPRPNNVVRASLSGVTGNAKFYRISLGSQ